MALFTILDDSYDVKVIKSFKALCNYIISNVENPCIETSYDDEPDTMTKELLKLKLDNCNTVRVYECEDKDWKYKIQKHGVK